MLIGVVDSGIGTQSTDAIDQTRFLEAGRDFSLDHQGNLLHGACVDDQLSHGAQVIQTLAAYVERPRLCVARVFDKQLATSAMQVAAAIDWLTRQQVSIINLSLGLRHDRDCMREACVRALRAGVVLVASSPAHGDVVYPSGYQKVISVTGDARCDTDEFAHLNSTQALFGACVRSIDGTRSGASMATAHVTGKLVQLAMASDGNLAGSMDRLCQSADHQGADLTPYR